MKKLLTVRMAAEVLHRYDNTICHWIAEGLLPAPKVRHCVYMTERDVCRFLKNGRARLAAAPRPAYGIGQRLQAEQPQYACRPSPLAQSVEAPSAALPQQHQTLNQDGRGLTPMAPGTRPSPIRQPTDAEPTVERGQQSHPALRRHGLPVRSRVNPTTVCRTLSAPDRVMVVCGRTPVMAATDEADRVLCCLPHNSYLCCRDATHGCITTTVVLLVSFDQVDNRMENSPRGEVTRAA